MAYTKTTWVDDSTPAINATNLNKIETGIDEAHDHMASTSNPHSVTAAQAGADPTGTAAAAVSNHNGSAAAHGLNVAATVGALPLPDAGGYYTTDTITGQLQQVGSQLAQKANIAQEAWITPTLLNSWAEVSGYQCRYMKDNFGFVHIKGRIDTGTAGTTAFALPAGYRPGVQLQFLLAQGTATSLTRVSIASGGQITIGVYTTYVEFGEIIFKAEA